MIALEPPIDYLTATVPLYIQIAEGLLARIESGELTPGDRLPPERELSETLGVTRMTLRQALRVLETQGLLVRRQGIGTYIAKPKIERAAGQLVPFTKVMQQRGYATGARVIMLQRQPVEVAIANQLKLPVSAPVYYGHRLRLINQEPVMLEKFIFPAHRFPNFEQHDLVNRSMYEIMETEYRIKVSQAQQSLEAVSATEYEAGLLEIEVGAPLMLEQRLGFDQNGRPIEFSKDLFR
ncbi:MAG TPA: GntR family transcriptional regulator, partial [Anaerolineae bacterium]|nr:GntR family transcriptional regulator [Anaerolineae bacterium]